MKFNELNIIEPIVKAVHNAGYSKATEIQAKAIPVILKGRDIIGCAQTGTGKTASFAIPVLQLLHEKPSNTPAVRALVLTPTRELALQVSDNFKTYGQFLPVKHLAIFGGVPQGKQVEALQKGADILIATPGRLLDFINQGIIDLSRLEILVLDEADRMLDMGFVHDVKKILTKIPKKRHTLFFSATMPKEIREFSQTLLYKPEEINVTPVSSSAKTVKQSVYFVEKEEKTQLLIDLLKKSTESRNLIFVRTKHGADRLARKLTKAGLKAAAIHGDKSQNARQKALEDFKNSRIGILIATDIAARGIDIDELPSVINFDLPNVPETYVHRIGRTGRAGMEGTAISFCEESAKKDLKNIEKLIGLRIPVKTAEPQAL